MGRRVQPYTDNFMRGLQDTHPATDLDFPGWSVFQDTRVGRGTARRRPGTVKLAEPIAQQAVEFNGTLVSVPNRGVDFLGKRWCIETLISGDNLAAQFVVGWATGEGPVFIFIQNAAIEVTLYDEDGTRTDLRYDGLLGGTITPIRVCRNIGTAELWVHGELADSQVIDPTKDMRVPNGAMNIGGSADVASYAGMIDFVRAMKIIPSTRHMMQRWPHPLGRYMLLDYVLEFPLQYDGVVIDRTWHRNHGSITGTVAGATSIAHKSRPVQGLRSYVDSNNQQRLAMVIGGHVGLEVI